jgi:hypothetical protein
MCMLRVTDEAEVDIARVPVVNPWASDVHAVLDQFKSTTRAMDMG